MATKQPVKSKKAGRPPTLTMPEPIPDTPENVAEAMMRTPARKPGEWKYMQNKSAKNGWPNAAVQEGSI